MTMSSHSAVSIDGTGMVSSIYVLHMALVDGRLRAALPRGLKREGGGGPR